MRIIQPAAVLEFKVRYHLFRPVRSLSVSLSSALKVLHENIAAGAMHNSKEHYDSPKCHPDTRKAVLSDITSWISDHSKETCILWLRAPAGSGKSAILQQIAEHYYNSGGLAASFFFSRSATKRNRETFLIATLASQLATSIPATKPLIEERLSEIRPSSTASYLNRYSVLWFTRWCMLHSILRVVHLGQRCLS